MKIKCECRKPNIGLVKKAVNIFNINLKESFFIGDTFVDVKTAMNLKINSILVKSNQEKFQLIEENLKFVKKDTLLDAVKYIIKK